MVNEKIKNVFFTQFALRSWAASQKSDSLASVSQLRSAPVGTTDRWSALESWSKREEKSTSSEPSVDRDFPKEKLR